MAKTQQEDFAHKSTVTEIRARCGAYLTSARDSRYRDHVFEYIEREDTPRPLAFQLELLRETGFVDLEVLHKSACFAAFGGLHP